MKSIKKLLPTTRPHWVGDGFNVYPVLGQEAFTNEISPFLMFDYAAPKVFKPSSKKLGVGQHPHRGFETVTIAYQGEVEHADSVGHRGVIGAGDVQWMTAASGIIHEEFHSTNFAKEGGMFEMAQLWVNLPAKYKMSKPRYQPITAGQIPNIPLPDDSGDVRVIAGEFAGTQGRASTFTPVNLWDLRLLPGKSVELSLPLGHNTILFVRKGSVQVGDRASEGSGVIGEAQAALLTQDGTTVLLKVSTIHWLYLLFPLIPTSTVSNLTPYCV